MEFVSKYATSKIPFSRSAVRVITKTFSTLYLHVIIGVYLSILLTGLSSLPRHHHDIEPGVMLLYLYLVSNIYLVLILAHHSRPAHAQQHPSSHGSAFLRNGAVLFGIGSLLYTFLNFIGSVLSEGAEGSTCHYLVHRLNSFFLSTFVLLQMVLVVLFPRLDLSMQGGLSHMGLMHLIATNAVMWIRTIVKESILEIHEIEDEVKELEYFKNQSHVEGGFEHAGHHFELDKCYSNLEENFTFLHTMLESIIPILYPFMIEFSLIGVTVFFSMWRSVDDHQAGSRLKYTINIKSYLSSLDWNGSKRGLVLGLVVLLLNIVNIIVFLQFGHDEGNTDEWIAKLGNTMTNTVNVIATSIAIWKIQQLDDKDCDGGLDGLLLYLSGFFLIIYSILEILVGVYGHETGGYSSLQILNGVFSILSTCLQILFLQLNFTKGFKDTREDESDTSQNKPKDKTKVDYPGRQEIMFLVMLNLSQWLVSTFALQRHKASRTEAAYFGYYTWVLIQRITLPLSIFFRFHSTVILFDSWKNDYRL